MNLNSIIRVSCPGRIQIKWDEADVKAIDSRMVQQELWGIPFPNGV
jgi:hypothetical protein